MCESDKIQTSMENIFSIKQNVSYFIYVLVLLLGSVYSKWTKALCKMDMTYRVY